MKNEIIKEWKFEPDPITRSYIDYLEKSPIEFDKLNQQIETIRKEVEEKEIIYINLYRNDYSKICE